MRRAVFLGLCALAGATLTGCAQKPELYAEEGWVRLAAVPGRPAAAYFIVHGGPKAVDLISVSSDVAITSEMHEGGMAMKKVDRVPIPAGGTVAFAPGGRHVMLYDMNPGVKPGRILSLLLSFSDGTRLRQGARVIGAGDPAPE
ncbi:MULTISPECIES: copper chaperone PCu(A)C [unclassified Sphingomonas]|uniref:copper chaperone PCu(A)C n=1 Tax=unclassified Sphingomonas TaxID=196159 RepID=UPI0028604FFD|nr:MULTISPECIES: copper chaperone PCu(A)C [unclassified Sphingomonas]MDR6113522.1 copper(I)-binding protein [Sphingomonas sp. SORGH_AS_0789]MDR6149117.1 copper(I)-binding protein [Sphingomonas sp. SORGH_AS_0742]